MNRFCKTSFLLIVAFVGFSCLSASVCQAQRSDTGSNKKTFRKYAEELIKKFDTNKDGELQEDELAKMRRKPEGADTDNDGGVTSDELIEYYMKRVRRSGLASTSGESAATANGQKDDSKKLDSDPAETLTVDVVVLRASDDSPLEKLATNIRGKSIDDVEQMLNAVRADEEFVCDHDTMQFSTNWYQEFRLRVGAQKPIIDGMSSRNGNLSTSFSTVSVGTRLIMTATNRNNSQVLNIDFDKSSVFDSDKVIAESKSGEKTYGKTIGNVEFKSEFTFERNKANVVSMSESGSTWVLIVVVQ